MARSRALTVIMPPNPVLARLLSTVTSPLNFMFEVWVGLWSQPGSTATGKSCKSTLQAARKLPSVDEICGNVRRCPGSEGVSPCTAS